MSVMSSPTNLWTNVNPFSAIRHCIEISVGVMGTSKSGCMSLNLICKPLTSSRTALMRRFPIRADSRRG